MSRKEESLPVHGETHAKNSCRTCRQKRVKCDRLLPTCLRCSSLKIRCLGYERRKTLVWTNSIASRGKMMGRETFAQAVDKKTPQLAQKRPQSWAVEKTEDNKEEDPGYKQASTRILMSLIEPGLQDLSPDCRNYIRYFDIELSKECVVYNNPAANPFLALMPLMPGSKALNHIMVSIAAFHFTHRIALHQLRDPSAENYFALRSPEQWESPEEFNRQISQPSYRKSFQTALLHKQQALQHLKAEIRESSGGDTDAVIATVILFICVDVVESGDRGWKYHLRGAWELIRDRKLLSGTGGSESLGWLKYFETACTTFGIMGATLAPADDTISESSIVDDESFSEILRQSEDQTWVGCPAELLLLLSAINSLRPVHRPAIERPGIVRTIHDRLQRFSPSAWARNFPDESHYDSRFYLANAYKTAVEIYASHIMGPLQGEDYLSATYIDSILSPAIIHMRAIPPHDFHIKSLVWPAFVMGAETQIVEHRQAIRTIFQHIWVSSCCCNAKKAAEMLDRIWNRDPYKSTAKTWLDYICEREESWLFL